MAKTLPEKTEQEKTSDWLEFYLTEFEKESDRAAVILTCALIDDTLREVLEARMLSCPTASDPLFDGANAPLSTFSSRIECAYRFGMVTRDFASALHTLRKIRNSFAHDVAGCSFGTQSVKNRVDSLCHLSKVRSEQVYNVETYSWHNPRDRFCFVVGYFIWRLKKGHGRITEIDEAEAIDCKFTQRST